MKAVYLLCLVVVVLAVTLPQVEAQWGYRPLIYSFTMQSKALLVLCLVALVLAVTLPTTEAQWGYGMGYPMMGYGGYGMGMGMYRPYGMGYGRKHLQLYRRPWGMWGR
ncbi:hypothetical protein M3Y99_01033000 [Aphelenchoides fujianensis]|nr:hypothetical protein M3Y99_01033000 [Aphelenchoides fujianensis]